MNNAVRNTCLSVPEDYNEFLNIFYALKGLGYSAYSGESCPKELHNYYQQEKYSYIMPFSDDIYCGSVVKQGTLLTLSKFIHLHIEHPIEIRLNDQHIAVVFKNHVQVGCQRFDEHAINSLCEAWAKQRGGK